MVFMLALCLLFGFIGMRLQRAREQQVILRELEEAGWAYSLTGTELGESNLWNLAFVGNYIGRIKNVAFVRRGVEERLDLSPLIEIKNLKVLNISKTQVSDLTPLAELMYLEKLEVSRTPVSDLSSLANLKNLEELYLFSTQVSDLTPLTELKNLRRLHIRNTPVSEQQIKQLQKALPNCDIIH